MLGRGGSWVGNSIAGMSLGRYWLYQDFAAGSGPNITITGNDNGTGLSFDSARIVDNSAVVTKTDGNPIFTNVAELPSQLVAVSSHTGTAVVLDSTPAVGEGQVRIWYLYTMTGADVPADAEIAPKFVTEARSVFLDGRYLDAALNLSDLLNAATARTNLGFTAQTAGQVLLGDGGTTFTSESTLFWDTSNDRLGIGTNSPSEELHLLKTSGDAARVLVDTQLTGSYSSIRLSSARTANSNLANGDTVGGVIFVGRAGGANERLGRILCEYDGDGTTLLGDIIFLNSQGGANPVEVLRLNSSGQIDTTLGAGAVQSDASGILTSGTLGVTYGGTGTSTQFTAGSVIFAGASGVYSQDNAAFFWNAATDQLTVGTNTVSSNYRALFKMADDNFGSGIALEGSGASSARFWEFFASAGGFLYLRNPGASINPLTVDNTGKISVFAGSPGAQFHIRNETSDTGGATIRVQAIGSQTGDLLQFYDSAGTSKIAFFDVSANLTLPTATIKTSLIVEDPGAGTNTVTIQSGTVSGSYSLTLPTAQGANGETLVNNGSGVLSWGSPGATHKAGVVTLSNGATSRAITFGTARADANYTPVVSFFNSADSDPVYMPYTIIAIATTGFTVEWTDVISGSNYSMYWGIQEHYDP